ncbi:MAG: hypothetical protein RL429_1170 [Bacteroidota bacterium]|jgi:hypothetical protein
METIGTGHWIFAGFFAVAFLAFLVWSYRSDRSIHETHYRGAYRYLLGIFVLLMVIYIFKRVL